MIDPSKMFIMGQVDLAAFDVDERKLSTLTANLCQMAVERYVQEINATAFRKCRDASGLGVVEYGQALGYQGNANTISRLIRSFEDGTKAVPTYIQKLVIMLWRYGIPDEFLTPAAIAQRRAKGLAR